MLYLTFSKRLCWRVDCDEDKVSLVNSLVDVSGEEEIATEARGHNVAEAGLIDREMGGVPILNEELIE